MLFALFVDSVDGSLARRLRVAERIPQIDGRRLDDVVDFLNYAIVPVVFMVWIGALAPCRSRSAPVLASAYGFAQHDAKTDDDFFLGWPSYWNVRRALRLAARAGPDRRAGAGALLLGGRVRAAEVHLPEQAARAAPHDRRSEPARGCWRWPWWSPGRSAPRSLHLAELSLLFVAWYVGFSAWLGGWWRRDA